MHSLNYGVNRFFELDLGLNVSDNASLLKTLDKFCKTGEKEDAFCVYYCFCEVFKVFGSGYDTMGKLVEFLSDHEYHSGELLTKHRDHYSHSVYVFALGLAIYACDGGYKNAFKKFYNYSTDREFFYIWGLASLFHDIGYPFQLAHEQIKVYVESLWGEQNPTNPFVSYSNMQSLTSLDASAFKACGYESKGGVGELLALNICERLGYPYNEVEKLLKTRYENQPAFMDHGYFSALLLARRLIDSNTPFTKPIVDVLSAIALHNNLNRFDIKRAINASTAISLEKHPLAYLLILCDELQNWDRQAFGYVSKKDPLAWGVKLDITDNHIIQEFIFSSLEVVTTEIKSKGFESVTQEVSRPNQNVLALMGKKFKDFSVGNYEIVESDGYVGSIQKLLNLHTKLEATFKVVKKKIRPRNYVSSNKFINLCDFAKAIHESYRKYQKECFGIDVKPFEELTLDFKLSNIEQAKSYDDKLELINCFYSDKELDYPLVNRFTDGSDEKVSGYRDELGFLSREEHLRWVREKLSDGWVYGTEYIKTDENGNVYQDINERNAKKIHKDLVPYDLLSKEDKEKDRIMIKNMIPFLYKYGHGVRIYSYREGRKPVLNVAGCGHRTIKPTDEIKRKIKQILLDYSKDYRVVVRTNFAYGADQIIAECACELGLIIKGAIPFVYEEYIKRVIDDSIKYGYKFCDEEILRMRHLLAQTVSLKIIPDAKYTYLEASKYIINKCDKLIALWDGVKTKLESDDGLPVNQGGTYHNILIAQKSRGLEMDKDIHVIKCER